MIEKSELTNMSDIGAKESDIPADLCYLDNTQIVQLCTENTNILNPDVHSVPLLPAQMEFGGLSPIESEENSDLPVYGPLEQFDTKISSKGDISDSVAVPGICGLRNLGNTCFMNAGLQCIFNNKMFIRFFMENYFEHPDENLLTNRFAEIMKKVWSGQYSVLDLSSFKDTFGKIHSQFQNYRQHDCQEFLALLLDTMHEQLKLSAVCKTSPFSNLHGLGLHEADSLNFHSNLSNNSEQNIPHKVESLSNSRFCKEIQNSKTKIQDSDLCSGTNKLTLSSQLGTKCEGFILKSLLRTDTLQVSKLHEFTEESVVMGNNEEEENVVRNFEKKYDSGADTTTCEKNTEKTVDMLINKENLNKILNKNELDEEIVPDHILKQKLCNVKSNCSSPLPIVDHRLEKNELVCKINTTRKVPNIEDFLKDTKTLNTNVLISDETNNLLKFDSEKFPKYDYCRLQETVDNLAEMSDFHTKQNTLKRVKVTNLIHDRKCLRESNSSVSIMSTFVNKRLKIDNRCDQKGSDENASDKDNGIDLEPAIDYCSEESSQSSELNVSSNECQQVSFTEEEFKANREWEIYKAANKSVITSTFHGQFRSSVVCSKCSHVSITYEPFMYLPVPLPHALERQIVVTYVQNKVTSPVRYLVNVKKYDKVKKIKEILELLLDDAPQEIILAEVFENHISRFLDSNVLVRHVNDISRSVYAFEVRDHPGHKDAENINSAACSSQEKATENLIEDLPSVGVWDDASSTHAVEKTCQSVISEEHLSFIDKEDDIVDSSALDHEPPIYNEMDYASENDNQKQNEDSLSEACSNVVQWNSCAICLEETPDFSLMLHPPCRCVLCKNCIEVSCKHYGSDSFLCPVCSSPVSPAKDFVPLNGLADYKFKISLIPIPLVIRHDLLENKVLKYKNLVGHPRLLKLPTSLPAAELYECIDSYIPLISTYSLLLVDGQGKNCSRCLYNQHCSGCEVARIGDVKLKPGDSLAVRYLDLSKESIDRTTYVSDHKSMQQKRHKSTLTVYDCIEAFSESENLDENSPWFCPACSQNQQAVKSLSIWRWPDILIVCLKRFVFLEYTSIKLDDKVVFPLEGLNLASYTSGPSSNQLIYDLQAGVCHFGSVASGHYTSFSKHALSNEWYYFNDEFVNKQTPSEEECVNEYILFYQRRDQSS